VGHTATALLSYSAASFHGGGLGMRYTVRIRWKEVYLFEDEGRWFLEK